MQPRLKSSKKWTNLPPDVATQIQNVFEKNFQKELGKARLVVEGRLYPQEILLRVGYAEPGRLVQNNFEISMDYVPEDENAALNTIHLCVDVAASLLTEHFDAEAQEEGALEIPAIWTKFPFEETEVWIQYTTENSTLEKQANEILGEWDDSLVHLEEDEEDEFDDSETGSDTETELDADDDSDSDAESDPEDGDSGPKGTGNPSGTPH